jgi:phage/plasmid primase-like uncharacterized protein
MCEFKVFPLGIEGGKTRPRIFDIITLHWSKKETYKGYEDSDISKGELRKWKTEQAKAIKAFEEEQRAEQEGVAKKLAETFNKLLISGESDYLKRKGVEAHGLHFFNDGSIAIPARDIDENITTLQTINSNV